jgi:uncharacterized membrane protein YfcA
MGVLELLVITTSFFLAAMLYSSVGHAGASAYLAVMALVGIAPDQMKPAALMLNLFVASIGAIQFYRAGHFHWNLFWPFALTSVPFAFIGGVIKLPGETYKLLVGLVLVFAAVRLLWQGSQTVARSTIRSPELVSSLVTGVLIGGLAGLTGTGGGIFFTPLLVLTRWADPKQATGISPAFILVNSVAGLLGTGWNDIKLPPDFLIWCIAVVAGGTFGSYFGSKRLGSQSLRMLLAFVLLIAGAKLLARI